MDSHCQGYMPGEARHDWLFRQGNVNMSFLILQPINQYKQQQPNHVNKVPIPGDGLEAKMVFGLEVPRKTAAQNHH